MDKWGWFFGWVGVVALLFVVPLNILSNFLTPKVSAWWALTSVKRREDRIIYLRASINVLQARLHPRSRQESFLLGIHTLTIVVGLMLFITTLALVEAFYAMLSINKSLSFPTMKLFLLPSPESASLFAVIIAVICYLVGLFILSRASRDILGASKNHLAKQLVCAQMELKKLEK